MPPNLTAAHSDGRCRLHRTRAVGGEPNSQCGRAVRMSRQGSTSLSLSLHASHRHASVQPHNPPPTLALQIFMLHVVAEGAGS
jgi:hypothetical protein